MGSGEERTRRGDGFFFEWWWGSELVGERRRGEEVESGGRVRVGNEGKEEWGCSIGEGGGGSWSCSAIGNEWEEWEEWTFSIELLGLELGFRGAFVRFRFGFAFLASVIASLLIALSSASDSDKPVR